MLPPNFTSADLWVVPAGSSLLDDLLVVDNPALTEILGMFPTDLHEQLSDIIKAKLRDGFYGLIISPNWPKGRMAILQVGDQAIMRVGLCALLWWMLEHDQARVHIILPNAPRWVQRFENLTVWDYEGVLRSDPRPASPTRNNPSAPRKTGARNRNVSGTKR